MKFQSYRNHRETANTELKHHKLLTKMWDSINIKAQVDLRYFVEFFSEFRGGSLDLYPWRPQEDALQYNYYDFHCHTIHSDGAPTHEEIVKYFSKSDHLSGFATTDHLFHIGVQKDGSHKREANEKVIHQSYSLLKKIEQAKSIGKIRNEFLFIPGASEFGIRVDPDNNKSSIEIIGLGLPEMFIEQNGGLSGIKKTPAIEFIEKIHDNSGIAILAHPFYFNQGLMYPEIWKKCDAIENFNHTNYFWADRSIQGYFDKLTEPEMVRRIFLIFLYFNWAGNHAITKLGLSGTGSSDSHIMGFYGAGATAFREKYTNFDDLAQNLKKGKGLPCLNPLWKSNFCEIPPIEQMYQKWGRDFQDTILKIRDSNKAVFFILKGLSYYMGLIEQIRIANFS